MILLENVRTYGWNEAIRGMRNPLNSWGRMDSYSFNETPCLNEEDFNEYKQEGLIPKQAVYEQDNPCSNTCDPLAAYHIGKNDKDLMKRLRNAGTDHRKFMRFITVYFDVTAPLYFLKEFDTYKVGTVSNSCSTMHKIQAKEFTLDDVIHEYLITREKPLIDGGDQMEPPNGIWLMHITIQTRSQYRDLYLETKDKKYWWQMIQLLPSSYNQKRTVLVNYEVLANMYKSRKNHKLDEWQAFCKFIETLPYSWLITGEFNE